MNLITEEREGVVRREAVILITKLLKHEKLPMSEMDHLYSLLCYCTVNDLYWEVKIAGISFWTTFVCRQCAQQGMIDGKFPNVTFSIEHKKIITLNEYEIEIRIKKILNDLSTKGCLGVFLACLNDDCDLQVVKLAIITIQKLLTSLIKYNYKEDSHSTSVSSISPPKSSIEITDTNFSEFASPPTCNLELNDVEERPLTNGPSHSSATNLIKMNEILDSIVDADDMTLLADAYDNQLNVNNSKSKIKDDYYKTFYVSASEFLKTIYKINLDEVLQSKSHWISQTENFESLLDDILLSFKDLNINDADCY